MKVEFELNGTRVGTDVEARTTLADCIRDQFKQTGTHLACEHGVCGACTVLINGQAVRSCLILAVQAQGERVVTVEGLSRDKSLTPLQTAFRKHHALQCGFCTPGFITTAHALLTEEPEADEERIRDVLPAICVDVRATCRSSRPYSRRAAPMLKRTIKNEDC